MTMIVTSILYSCKTIHYLFSHSKKYLGTILLYMSSGPVSFPPIGVMVGAVCVSNLIKRHPNCKVLLHRREGDYTPNTDTFDLSEPDPAKCRALESSLWELKVSSIAEHYSIQTIHV